MTNQPKKNTNGNVMIIRVLVAMITVGATICIAFMGAVSSKYNTVHKNDVKQDVKIERIETSYEFIQRDLCEIKESVKNINTSLKHAIER